MMNWRLIVKMEGIGMNNENYFIDFDISSNVCNVKDVIVKK